MYEYNLGLCGDGFSSLKACNASDHSNPNRPEPYGAGVGVTPKEIPETANIKLPCNTTRCQNSSKSKKTVSVTVGLVLASIAVSAVGILAFTMYRRRKQKLGSAFDITESRLSTDQNRSIYRKLGCSIFLLPEDIIEVNQKMILTLSTSIMYWSLQNSEENSLEASPVVSADGEHETDLVNEVSDLAIDDNASVKVSSP